MRTLYVKGVTKQKVAEMWGVELPAKYDDVLYIRCNASGEINWDKAPVFEAHELIERGNYKLLK